MEKKDLVMIHACAEHIIGHAKTIRQLMEVKLISDAPMSYEKMWKRDLQHAVEHLEEELIAIKKHNISES
jgi:hypothetical protein